MNWNPLESIIHHLIIKTPLLKDIGLLEGRMGILITFYELSKELNDEIYSAYAGELLDQVFTTIHNQFPVGFESGLSGIGWGIEYLIQNKFVEGDGLEICEEIDSNLMNVDPRRMNDFSFDNGLHGILHYILAHIKGCMVQERRLPFDNIYLTDLYHKINDQLAVSEDGYFISTAEHFKCFYETGVLNYTPSIAFISEKMDKNFIHDKIDTYSLGIRKGLASIILNRYT